MKAKLALAFGFGALSGWGALRWLMDPSPIGLDDWGNTSLDEEERIDDYLPSAEHRSPDDEDDA